MRQWVTQHLISMEVSHTVFKCPQTFPRVLARFAHNSGATLERTPSPIGDKVGAQHAAIVEALTCSAPIPTTSDHTARG